MTLIKIEKVGKLSCYMYKKYFYRVLNDFIPCYQINYLQDSCMIFITINAIFLCGIFLLLKIVIFCNLYKIEYLRFITSLNPLLAKCTLITKKYIMNKMELKLEY